MGANYGLLKNRNFGRGGLENNSLMTLGVMSTGNNSVIKLKSGT